MKTLHVALAGNPNCGKTTVFNALTGSRKRVGNWPGVTVERMVGEYDHCGATVEVTDLPGIYSFSALSPDEIVARKHILFDKPDVVVNVIDASNLERNLYLTTQLLEMDVPVVVALNMMDMAQQRGVKIDVEHLQTHLGCSVVPIVATRKKGLEELRCTVCDISKTKRLPGNRVQYDAQLEPLLRKLEVELGSIALSKKISARWLAIKVLEKDPLADQTLGVDRALLPDMEDPLRKAERIAGNEVDMLIADGRYGFINGLVRDVTKGSDPSKKSFTDRIDQLVLHRFFGFPIFFFVMYVVFALTINVGAPFIDFFDVFMGTIFVDGFRVLLASMGSPEWLMAVLADGVGGGLQSVSTFIPPIFLIFFCLSLLEDSGYMSRAAFVMDHFLRKIGLPGKAFIPMLVGFGCNVPGITATRTLDSRRERILAIMMNPFMSCGARLPVYTLFAAAFFPDRGGVVIFGIYLIGIALAVLTGLLFKHTLLRGEASHFVMELPPYHLPTFNGVLFHTWHRLKSFLIKAGKLILLLVTILGFLNTMGTDGSFGHADSSRSVLSSMSRAITPAFHPMGIEDENWPATVGLFTGIFAKEAVVGTLDSLYGQLEREDAPVENEPFDFGAGIAEAFSMIPAGFEGFSDGLKDPLGLSGALSEVNEADVSEHATMVNRFGKQGEKAAFAYLLFILIYAPCVAALAAIHREIGLGWMLLAVSYLTGLAWISATLYYQVATFAANPATSSGWIAGCVVVLLLFVMGMRLVGNRDARRAQ
jgi:ferrous iron transport protein B